MEFMKLYLKKTKELVKCKKTDIDSELGRINVIVSGGLAESLKPEERIYSTEFTIKALKLCTKLSFRNAEELINSFLHRRTDDAIKLRTLSDYAERVGKKISNELIKNTSKALNMYGFDYKTGIIKKGVTLSQNIISLEEAEEDSSDTQIIQNAIDEINKTHDEKVRFEATEMDIECNPDNCVYVSIDEIGVKKQKVSRSLEYVKTSKYVENTVIHINHNNRAFVLTASDMSGAVKSALAFLLINELMKYRLVFFTDGARNIKNTIEKLFSFHPYTIILDWYHLKKKCQELLSMALRGKKQRNEVLKKLLCILWVGNVEGAVVYLKSISSSIVKNQNYIKELIEYLGRKKAAIPCYAVRDRLGLRNSSNSVEKENDILVAQRQKHNGMAWSKKGSSALAAIEMVFRNGDEDIWFHQKKLPFNLRDNTLGTVQK